MYNHGHTIRSKYLYSPPLPTLVCRMLYDFCRRQGADKVWATYIVVGRRGNCEEGATPSLEVRWNLLLRHFGWLHFVCYFSFCSCTSVSEFVFWFFFVFFVVSCVLSSLFLPFILFPAVVFCVLRGWIWVQKRRVACPSSLLNLTCSTDRFFRVTLRSLVVSYVCMTYASCSVHVYLYFDFCRGGLMLVSCAFFSLLFFVFSCFSFLLLLRTEPAKKTRKKTRKKVITVFRSQFCEFQSRFWHKDPCLTIPASPPPPPFPPPRKLWGFPEIIESVFGQKMPKKCRGCQLRFLYCARIRTSQFYFEARKLRTELHLRIFRMNRHKSAFQNCFLAQTLLKKTNAWVVNTCSCKCRKKHRGRQSYFF